MGLRELGSTLPPGFRFHPSDEELVCHYLCKKMANEKGSQGTMVEVDLHTREPWELPEAAKLTPNEWYFFSFRDRKYATGFRANRATKSGYWKATGKDRTVYSPRAHVVIGMRKTLVFYRGRAPNGMKTNWVMHEFRLETHLSPPKEDWVLCRVFHKRKGEEEKETTTCCAETSPALWFSTSSAVVDQPLPDYDQDMNGCTLSTITTYQEDDNKNHSNSIYNSSLLQSSSDIYDFTHEQHGLLWDIGQDQFGHEMLNLEELDF